jgi:hypothetical protein
LLAAVKGWKAAHCSEEEQMQPLSDDEHDALMAKYG